MHKRRATELEQLERVIFVGTGQAFGTVQKT
jgi:hypothetical protein